MGIVLQRGKPTQDKTAQIEVYHTLWQEICTPYNIITITQPDDFDAPISEPLIPPEDITLSNSLNTLFNFGPLVAFQWRLSEDWPVVVEVSANAITPLGYSVDQLLADEPGYRKLIHPNDLSRIIQEVVRRLQNRVRDEETVARIGGDEMVWRDDFATGVEQIDEQCKILIHTLQEAWGAHLH
jgi:hypothetical protein